MDVGSRGEGGTELSVPIRVEAREITRPTATWEHVSWRERPPVTKGGSWGVGSRGEPVLSCKQCVIARRARGSVRQSPRWHVAEQDAERESCSRSSVGGFRSWEM